MKFRHWKHWHVCGDTEAPRLTREEAVELSGFNVRGHAKKVFRAPKGKARPYFYKAKGMPL